MYYCLHELHYSPSELKQLYDAPKELKAFLYAAIGHKLAEIAKEVNKPKKGGK